MAPELITNARKELRNLSLDEWCQVVAQLIDDRLTPGIRLQAAVPEPVRRVLYCAKDDLREATRTTPTLCTDTLHHTREASNV